MKKIVLSLGWLCAGLLGCSTEGDWTLETDYMRIAINQQGYITSFKNTTVSPQREFSAKGKPSPLLSLYDESKQKYYLPQEASFNQWKGEVKLQYPNGSEATVKLEEKEKYIRMQLLSLSNREHIDAIQWGSYHTNIDNLFGEIIGVARDTTANVNYSIGVLALNDNTVGGTANLVGDAAPFEYVIHTPDSKRFPLPDSLHEGQVFCIGGDGISDVAFYSHKEPYYRILYGNSATIDSTGQISLQYFSRDRQRPRQVYYSLIPHMAVNAPTHIDVEPLPGVDYIGSSIALWGSPDDIALMDVVQDIVLSEGLPHPTWKGKWIKDPTAYRFDVKANGRCYDSIISYANQINAAAITAYDLGFYRANRGNGGYLDGKKLEKKPFNLASGNLSHYEYGKLAAEKGIMFGRTPITNSLAPGTKDIMPLASDSLAHQIKRTLAKEINETDTIIEVTDPTYLEEIAGWAGHAKHLNIVRIGQELIHYLGVSKEPPYRLLNVTRGYWKTIPAKHAANETIYKMLVPCAWGYEGILPNWALQQKVSEHFAEVCAKNNINFYDFDGQEFLFNNGHGYYSAKTFFHRLHDRAQELGVPYVRITGATLSEGSWHFQSIWNVGGGTNMYDVKQRVWGSTTSEGKDLRDVAFANYFPSSFGDNFEIDKDSKVEDYEHVEAISVGFGTTYSLKLNQQRVESCPQKYAIFKAMRTWESARWADAFPTELKKRLREPQYDWHLEEGAQPNTWTLYRMENGQRVETFQLKGKN